MERTKGEISARCDKEEMNYLVLGAVMKGMAEAVVDKVKKAT